MSGERGHGTPKKGVARSWRSVVKYVAVTVAIPVLVGTLTWTVQKVLEPTVGSGATTPAPSKSSGTTGTSIISPGPKVLPVNVDLVQMERTDEQGDIWIFPKPMNFSGSDLEHFDDLSVQDPEKHYRWARDRGGVDPGESHIKVVLRGNSTEQVRILGMRAITKCRAPLTGTILYSPPAGADDNIGLGFNLDNPGPYAQTISPEGDFEGDYFDRKTVLLEKDESVTLQITARTNRQYCEYTFRIDLLVKDRRSSQVIDNNRQPFRISKSLVHGVDYDPGPELSEYQVAYIGGVANFDPSGKTSGKWKRVDPSTWRESAG
jgi:hypothetical protein